MGGEEFTVVDVQKLRALLAAATPRPWHTDVWYGTDDGGWAAIGPHCTASEADGFDDAPESPSWDLAMADAALIAAAVNTLPELLDEVERLRARVNAVGRVLSENGCDCDCGCFWDEHGDGCDRCLACRVEDAIARRDYVVMDGEK